MLFRAPMVDVVLLMVLNVLIANQDVYFKAIQNTAVGCLERMLFRALMVDVVLLMVLNVLIANQDVHLTNHILCQMVGLKQNPNIKWISYSMVSMICGRVKFKLVLWATITQNNSKSLRKMSCLKSTVTSISRSKMKS